MIPFSHTWPYDIIYGDLYVQNCPFCSKENVLLPLKPKELQLIRDGKKGCWYFPAAAQVRQLSIMTPIICCLTVLSAEQTYKAHIRELPCLRFFVVYSAANKRYRL